MEHAAIAISKGFLQFGSDSYYLPRELPKPAALARRCRQCQHLSRLELGDFARYSEKRGQPRGDKRGGCSQT